MYKDYSKVIKTTTKTNTVNEEAFAINNSIKNILLTRRGSVPGKPRFGSDLYTLIFSQLDSLTESVAKSMVLSCLNEFEDRIKVTDIELKSIEEYNKLVITIQYKYRDNFNQSTDGNAVISISQ